MSPAADMSAAMRACQSSKMVARTVEGCAVETVGAGVLVDRRASVDEMGKTERPQHHDRLARRRTNREVPSPVVEKLSVRPMTRTRFVSRYSVRSRSTTTEPPRSAMTHASVSMKAGSVARSPTPRSATTVVESSRAIDMTGPQAGRVGRASSVNVIGNPLAQTASIFALPGSGATLPDVPSSAAKSNTAKGLQAVSD